MRSTVGDNGLADGAARAAGGVRSGEGARVPRWMAGADEDVWHNPVSGGEHPRTACGKRLTPPVRAQRGDLPCSIVAAPPETDPEELLVCPVCARKLGVDPVGERRTLRDARLRRALYQAEQRPYRRDSF